MYQTHHCQCSLTQPVRLKTVTRFNGMYRAKHTCNATVALTSSSPNQETGRNYSVFAF